jgi:phosphoribosyl 1,2-cyclic phosphate phosphodiesterase
VWLNTYPGTPCDCKPFPDSPLFYGADVLVLGNTFVADTLKGGEVIGPDHPLRRELFSLEQAMALREQYGIGRLVLTHLEEDWGRTYDDYRAMEQTLSSVAFAWDGMTIRL